MSKFKVGDRVVMTGVKHTPGPWELVSLSGYGSPFSVRMPYIATTANVGQTHYGVQSVRRREDALLIAAAPEMCDYILSSAQNGCATAQQIIARARGES